MAYTCSLRGCFAKLERAKRHRGELTTFIANQFPEVAIGSYELASDWLNNPNRCYVGATLDETTGQHVLKIENLPSGFTLQEFHEGVAVILGDIVNNLRSALDQLVHQLALVCKDGNLQSPDRTQFPIADKEATFTAAKGKNGAINELSIEHQNRIQDLQPYLGKQFGAWEGPWIHPLAELNKLSNKDKHRLLNPVLYAANASLTTRTLDGVKFEHILPRTVEEFESERAEFMAQRHNFKANGIIGRAKLTCKESGSGIKYNVPKIGFVTPKICIDEEFRSLEGSVLRIEEFVTKIVNDFEADLPS